MVYGSVGAAHRPYSNSSRNRMTDSNIAHVESGVTPETAEEAKFEFEIPRFSATASQLVNELNDPDVKVPKVVQLIECEPTIGSRVLKMANSPLYGATRAISTIGHAIVILGFRCVSQQAIAAASGDLFKAGTDACKKQRLETYSQSLGIATAARFIAQKTKIANPDEAFLCGVVHDVGKLILFQHACEDYARLLAESPLGDSTDLEIDKYGISHATLGGQCGEAWALPGAICASIANHHLSFSQAQEPLSKVLILSSYLARKWQLGFEEGAFAEDTELESELLQLITDSNESECMEQFEAIREICLQ